MCPILTLVLTLFQTAFQRVRDEVKQFSSFVQMFQECLPTISFFRPWILTWLENKSQYFEEELTEFEDWCPFKALNNSK